MKKIKYALAVTAMMVVSIALIAMIVLQIVDIKQLTLKQVGVAVLAMTACTAVIGGIIKNDGNGSVNPLLGRTWTRGNKKSAVLS